MIQVDHLSKNFGPVLAVDDVSFAVERGEIVGFLGLNGAGKTTTMRILTSYLPATRGVAKVAGYDVMNESMQVRQNIGYLPESVPLYPEMRVEEYLDYRAKLKGVERKQRTARIEQCLERCRIREVRRRLVGTLSKGYRQRVGLADSLIHDPPILILDEPTTGLDPLQIRETLAAIKELGEQHTILLSSHILSEVEAVCQRMIIIHKGRIGLDRKIAELAREDDAVIVVEVRGPADQVTAALKAVEGVTLADSRGAGDGVTAYELRAARGKDPREAVFQRVVKGGWTLRRLEQRRKKVEDHFVDVVLRADAAPVH